MNEKNRKIVGYVYYAGFALYAAIASCIVTCLPSEINNDIIAYLDIARKYSRGEWYEALNAYWSPLASWLMVPLVWLKINPLYPFRILNALAGFYLLYLTKVYIKKLELRTPAAITAFFTILIFTLVYQPESYSPDFLSIPFFFLFILQLQPSLFTGSNATLKFSISIFLLMFSKSIFIYFAPFIFLIYCFCYAINNRATAKSVLKKALLYLLIPAGMTLCWSLALYMKYDRVMISSAGTYNLNIVTPDGLQFHYPDVAGLIPPPGAALFSMEDPTSYEIDIPDYKKTIDYRTGILTYNLKTLRYIFNYFSLAGIFIIPFLLSVFFLHKNVSSLCLTGVGFSLLLLLTYCLLYIQERYTLPAYFMIILLSFYVLELWLKKLNQVPLFITTLAVVIMASMFLKTSLVVYREAKNKIEYNAKLITMTRQLHQTGLFNSKNTACNSDCMGFNAPALLAYFSDSRHYGSLAPDSKDETDFYILKKYGIDYLFFQGCSHLDSKGNCISRDLPYYLKNSIVVYTDPYFDLKIYKLSY